MSVCVLPVCVCVRGMCVARVPGCVCVCVCVSVCVRAACVCVYVCVGSSPPCLCVLYLWESDVIQGGDECGKPHREQVTGN